MSEWGTDFLLKLKPCKWRYKTVPLDDGKIHFGFIAQEVDEIASKDKYAFAVTDRQDMYGIRYHEFIGPIVKTIQEQELRIKQLEQELTQIKGVLDCRNNSKE